MKSMADYIRIAILRVNRKATATLRAGRLAQLSRLVRDESMRVNAEFSAIEVDPGISSPPSATRPPRP